ncbi:MULTISPECIES: hypothetical protein [Rhodobacterales]|uniref:hypothetical protein n=1 Tax=Ascidiaceihabitans sp. TaxID=1872644 RepID=UPI00329A4CA2
MKKAYALTAVLALLAAPVAAQQLPTNNTVSGGQGDVNLDGQAITAAAFGLTGTVTAVAIVGTVLFVTIVTDDGDEVVVTTTAPT